jgi:hypothetical protein
VGSTQKGSVEGTEECSAAAENIRRIGQLGDDPCPTKIMSVLRDNGCCRK